MMTRAPYGPEILNFQLVDRLNYLRNFIDNAPIKDLTTFYPQLGKIYFSYFQTAEGKLVALNLNFMDFMRFFPVNHIFGINDNNNPYGWGLRLVTDQNFNEFRLLYEFFQPLGPFLHLIYRLLNDTIKYELKTSDLPSKTRQQLESGSSTFYSSMFQQQTDMYQKKNSILSLSELNTIFFSITYFFEITISNLALRVSFHFRRIRLLSVPFLRSRNEEFS